MEIFSWLLLISFILYLFWKTVRPKKFPPGPKRLPFLGNLFQINIRNPLKDLDKYAQKYGPIFSLYAGGKPFVFVQGFSLVKEVLLTKGMEFAGRPENPFVEAVNNRKGIILAPYGQAWKEQRRFMLVGLRNFGLGKKSMEEKISDEAAYLMQIFEENMSVPFDPCDFIESAVANIISTTVFGKRFNYDDKSLRNVLDLFHENTTAIIGPWAQLYNAVPFVRRLPLPHQNLFKAAEKVIAFFSKEVEEHRATLIPGDHRDITDAYLEEIQKPENKGSSFEEEYMTLTMIEMFIAGVETTATTLGWGLLYMMAFPEVQEKCHVEINNVLGNNPCIQYEDRDKLPYTNAVIHEIQRFANVVPLGIPHAPVKDMQLFGYNIPKDTMIVTSLISVHYDESQWKYPREFNPSNFLNEKGEFVKPEAFLAFSAGPRVCLGENLARMELFLFFTHILRRFQVVWPDETKVPDLTPNFGVTLSPSCFKVALKCRPQL
ncbi:cytochrome P450 2J2-like isoform X1 [Eublepharis macularius]|uniref:Cytochrome P450 2J2-like isoform X1 n=1 Tax=Eublepharis macularius TaxID=481883 RepID=A0AA97KG64_EUBMA|nr:cytochrome P450 2J2-like isoform X1 [Eublepharis macularius]